MIRGRATSSPRALRRRLRSEQEHRERRSPVPDFVPPQLATLTSMVPDEGRWFFEDKLDGYRIMARIELGKVQLLSRKGHDWTERFRPIADALLAFRTHDVLLDGEVVAAEAGGPASFQTLQNFLRAKSGVQLRYSIFNLLWLDGEDLREQPLRVRKELLQTVLFALPVPDRLELTPYRTDHQHEFYERVCRDKGEGIICKRAESSYASGRTPAWLKVKCSGNEEFVVGGYTPLRKEGSAMGALLLGQYRNDNLIYVGRVGTGFSMRDREVFHEQLQTIKRDASPFSRRVPLRGSRVTWVEPVVVVQVTFTERTRDGILRHPSFVGIREDKSAKEVQYEQPRSAK